MLALFTFEAGFLFLGPVRERFEQMERSPQVWINVMVLPLIPHGFLRNDDDWSRRENSPTGIVVTQGDGAHRSSGGHGFHRSLEFFKAGGEQLREELSKVG